MNDPIFNLYCYLLILVPSVEVRRQVIIVVHENDDAVKSANRRHTFCPSRRQRHDLLRGVLHAIGNREIQTGFANYSLAFLDVGSFEPHDDGNFHA